MSGMIYDGYDFGHILRIDGIHRPVMPDVDVKSDDLSGDGARLGGVRLEAAEIEVDVRLYRPFEEVGTREGFERARRLLQRRLLRRSPCKLVLPDAPDMYNLAVLEGSTELERIAWNGTGTLSFYCADPRGYGAVRRRSSQGGTSALRVNVGGSYPTAPIIKVTAGTANLTVMNDGATMRVLGDEMVTEPVVIDNLQHACTVGDDTVMLDALDDYAEWSPGVHTLQCDYPFEVEWREMWL